MKHRFMKQGLILTLLLALVFSTTTFAFAAETKETWVRDAPMHFARFSFQTPVVNGKIYAIGGYNKTDNSEAKTPYTEEYDPSTKAWMVKASMKTGRGNFCAVVLDNKIYAIGGGTSSVEEYDPATDVWTPKASMASARENLQAEVVDGKIYALGGGNNTVEEYDPATDVWTPKASMKTSRTTFQAEVINGKIYVIGGGTSSVEEYDPGTNVWTPKASMASARTEFRTEVVNGKIFAIGGPSNSVEEYDPGTNVWTPKASMTEARDCFQTVHVGNMIYALAGRQGGLKISSVEAYDLNNDTWSTVAPVLEGNIAPQAAVIGNQIYIVGGWNYEPLNITEHYLPSIAYPTLTVTASPNKVKVGQQFTTDIAIHNETNICAEDIRLTYDKDLFEYEGATGQTGTKIYKEDASTPGTIRFITACQGKDTAATGDKGLITLKFKAKAKGVGKVDIIKGRIADNATLEEDVADDNCGEDTITVDGYSDVNRSGNFTLLDLGIDAYYDGMNASDTDSTKYDADVIPDGKIDDNDLAQITQEILANKDYAPNN